MATYFTPIERPKLPGSDPKRWMILPVEASNADTARVLAANTAQAILGRGFVVWAAVRDCPSFEHMQELRDSFDATKRMSRGRKVELKVAGYA